MFLTDEAQQLGRVVCRAHTAKMSIDTDPPRKRQRRKGVSLALPSTFTETRKMEEPFTEAELRDMVVKASAGYAEKVKGYIKSIVRPSEVWELNTSLWARPGSVGEEAILALKWKRDSVEILREVAELRRREESSPHCIEDARFLATLWIESGNIEVPRTGIPDRLGKTFDELILKYRENAELNYEARSESLSGVTVRAVCESLGVKYIERFRCRDTRYSADMNMLRRKQIRGNTESVVEGILELKSFTRGQKDHGAALVQAGKYVHSGRREEGPIGAVWVQMLPVGIWMNYRIGRMNWTTKKIVASDVRRLFYLNGVFDNREGWEHLLGYIKGMEKIEFGETCGGSEDLSSDESGQSGEW